MGKLRTLLSAITILATAVSPVAASLAPCCCTKQPPLGRQCCRHEQPLRAAKTAADEHSCCAKPADSPQFEGQRCSGPELSLRHGCCCVKALPATTDTRTVVAAKRSFEPLSFVAGSDLGTEIVLAPGSHERFRPLARIVISGPALLALHCIWRN